MKKLLFILTIAALIILSGCKPAKNYDNFARCLTAENTTMYGAYWCPHCNAVKKEFGNSFRFVNYVECDANGPNGDPEKCTLAGVQYFPTFIFKDGTRLFGEVSFDILAQKTGCTLPS